MLIVFAFHALSNSGDNVGKMRYFVRGESERNDSASTGDDQDSQETAASDADRR
jgi:hypothetical protein